jgi:hypothetical protein
MWIEKCTACVIISAARKLCRKIIELSRTLAPSTLDDLIVACSISAPSKAFQKQK